MTKQERNPSAARSYCTRCGCYRICDSTGTCRRCWQGLPPKPTASRGICGCGRAVKKHPEYSCFECGICRAIRCHREGKFCPCCGRKYLGDGSHCSACRKKGASPVVRVLTRPCVLCGIRQARKDKVQCDACRDRHRCVECHRPLPAGVTRRCSDCARSYLAIHAAHSGSMTGPTHPEMEDRLLVFATRAALGLPLFEGVPGVRGQESGVRRQEEVRT